MSLLEAPAVPMTIGTQLDPASVADAWQGLCDETSAAPFHRPGWYLRWAEAFAPGRLRVTVGWQNGRAVAVMPILVGRGRTRAPVNGHTPEFAVVAASPPARRHLLAEVAGDARRGLLLDVFGLDEDEVPDVSEALTSRVRHLEISTAGRTIATDVTGSWDDFLATLGADRRREIRRSMDRAARQGRVELTTHDDDNDLPRRLATFFDVEASGWKGREGTAIASRPTTRGFYEQMLGWAAEQGWLELRSLRLDGRLAAIQIALRHDGVLYLLKTGYDESLAAAAPGKALQHAIVRDGFADPELRRIEWCGDEGDLKRVLGNRSRPLYRLAAHPGGPTGSLGRLTSRSAQRGGDWARSHLPPGARARLRAARSRWQERPTREGRT